MSQAFQFKKGQTVQQETKVRILLVGKGKETRLGYEGTDKSANASQVTMAVWNALRVEKKHWSQMATFSTLFLHGRGTVVEEKVRDNLVERDSVMTGLRMPKEEVAQLIRSLTKGDSNTIMLTKR